MTRKQTLTQADIEAGYDNDEWLGFGYLGGRSNALDDTDPESPARPDQVALADEAILRVANELGWTSTRLFDWMNAKPGRWLADEIFGSNITHHEYEAVAAKYLAMRIR